MAAEVAPGQLGECLVGIERHRLRCTLRHQGVRVLFAPPAPVADDSLQLGVHQDVGQTGSVGLDPLGAETSRYLGPGELSLLTEPPLQQVLGPGAEQLVNAEIAICGGIGDVDPWRGQRLDPPDVLWSHEMPSRAERMGPQDLPFVDEPVDVGVD